ncbi:UNVERIFIED_CONTAM: hypothetical protein HDU68_012584 [Siphonaria sp. JEL0065]|nr:hypothetical protein HDU68_012584 [Siphonaria sp. JEL0065]
MPFPLSMILCTILSLRMYAADKLVPPNGKIVFGAWLDTSSGPVSGGDSHAAFNRRIGFNTGSFQLWQDLPPRPPKVDTDLGNHNSDGTIKLSVLDDGTTASLFLTIYPLDMNIITDAHITDLANQCNEIKKTTWRDVYVRLGPEMNGEWFTYGNQPEAFLDLWRRAYTILSKVSPHVAMVWSPNYNGPPNREPYDIYWPGADYVDWVGISVYWKGLASEYPWVRNLESPSDFVAQLIDAKGPEGGPVSFYQEYAVKYNKPMVIAESAAAFHVGTVDGTGKESPLDVGVGRTKTAMSFWNSFLFNPDFFKQYPLVKMVFCFEMYKIEDMDTMNDYRATLDSDTLVAFVHGLKQLDANGVVAWASQSARVQSGKRDGNGEGKEKKSSGLSLMFDVFIVSVLSFFL